ncbi:YlmC/YmxH family sporulation protein [Novisyntrophococcus fermenticellae]|uniref:YlmC/YmxH family sporulation protein n=1 Tax=Novisyntrophococcus fermenticellae TaxID=2068655 RepID=UPI001E2E1457|nr:YlmC/YmxH family sporulation protein [Novisyntrophococcus fermenticellae]
MRLIDLRQKEVINICDCRSLGCPIDIEFNSDTGVIIALIIPGPGKFYGFFGREKDLVIPWDCICQIGDDIILVKLPKKPPPPPPPPPPPRPC